MVWSPELVSSTDAEHITYDDVQILPSYSEVTSRSHCDVSTFLSRLFFLQVPIIAAPMDTVCGWKMMRDMYKLGGAGAFHRFLSIEDQISEITKARHAGCELTIASIGATGDYLERAEALIENGINVLLIDVAHGDHIHVKKALAGLNKSSVRSTFDVIAGNIATADAAMRLQDWGADALRVGIGGGAACTTRIKTGVGVPQLQAVMNVAAVAKVPVIADGGIRTPGDVAKAIMAGADTVMLGSMLAGTDASPGEVVQNNGKMWKFFRGSASASQKIDNGQLPKLVEGASGFVPYVGSLHDVVGEIVDGLRSAMSYVGATNLMEFRTKGRFLKITSSGVREAHPHGFSS